MATTGLELFSQRSPLGTQTLAGTAPTIRYRELEPGPADAVLIACAWIACVPAGRERRQRVLPDGCADVVFSDRAPALVYGPRTVYDDLQLPGGATFLGLRLRPETLGPALQVDAATLAGRVVALEDVVGIGDRAGPSARQQIADFLARGRNRTTTPDPIVQASLQALSGPGRATIVSTARNLGVSERQLHRRFSHAVGLSPAGYRRIVRFRRGLYAAGSRPGTDWARLARELGYADQAHLIRDFKRIAGTTPGRFERLARTSAQVAGSVWYEPDVARRLPITAERVLHTAAIAP